MLIISAWLAACLGAYAGKLMALTVNFLPQILFEGCDKGREPRDIIKWFFQRSQCLHCQHTATWVENLPIVGYLLSSGKCPECQQTTALRAYLLELGMALLFGVTALFYPFDATFWFVMCVSCLLICCFFTDFDHGILPDQLTISLIWVGLLGSLVPVFITPQEAIIGAIGGYGFFWLINELYRYFRGFDGMFPGDFKLNAGIGACIGLKSLLYVLVVGAFFLVVVSLLRILWISRKLEASDMHKEIAYACYVTVVAMAAILLKLCGIFVI